MYKRMWERIGDKEDSAISVKAKEKEKEKENEKENCLLGLCPQM